MKKFDFNKKKEYLSLATIPILLIIFALLTTPFPTIFNGLYSGLMWNNRLLSDSLEIMGIGASFFNAGLLGILTLIALIKLRLKPNGVIIASYLLMIAFAFLGKNLINVAPIIFGGYLYAKIRKVPFKNVLVVTLLATTIAPLLSTLLFISDYQILNISLFLVIGTLIGIVLPIISSHVVLAHNGYSLYNMGFAGGLLSLVIYGICNSLNINFKTNNIIYQTFHIEIIILLFIIFSLLIIIGLLSGENHYQKYQAILKSSGKLVSDFTKISDFSTTLINMGLLGILTTIIMLITQVTNGLTLTGALTIVGFGGFGKHLRNVIPVMIGISLASLLLPKSIHPSTIIMTIFLGTSLAPIAGEFGFLAGMTCGILHMLFVWNLSPLHGGINLYNNGLSCGIIAMVCLPILQFIKGEYE